MLSDLSLALTSPQKFFEWLQSQPEGSIVGVARAPAKCPLASFANTFIEDSCYYASVSPNYLAAYHVNDRDYQCHRIDNEWMKEFMAQVDRSSNHQITRERAMEILISMSENTVEEAVVDPVTV